MWPPSFLFSVGDFNRWGENCGVGRTNRQSERQRPRRSTLKSKRRRYKTGRMKGGKGARGERGIKRERGRRKRKRKRKREGRGSTSTGFGSGGSPTSPPIPTKTSRSPPPGSFSSVSHVRVDLALIPNALANSPALGIHKPAGSVLLVFSHKDEQGIASDP